LDFADAKPSSFEELGFFQDFVQALLIRSFLSDVLVRFVACAEYCTVLFTLQIPWWLVVE